ncbi:MAG: hypothetical protein ACRC68_19205, partial [Clostridium sp.]
TQSSNSTNQSSNSTNQSSNNTNQSSNNTNQSSNNTTEKTDSSTNNDAKSDEMSKKVKDYILSGQGDKPEALKLKWSKGFLEKVNMKSMYDKYIKDGGTDGDVAWFAKYITLYAPIPNDWEEMFKKDVYDNYKENIVCIKQFEGDLYKGRIIIKGVLTDYVMVSARTGYFHGTISDNNLVEVKGTVQLFAGAYFDNKVYGGNRLNRYNEVVISNITDSSFDFTVNELSYLDKNSTERTTKLIFKTNTAYFIEDGRKAVFYGNDYTLNFTFPKSPCGCPVVTDMKITGFKPLEGNTYVNSGIPGHEFG